MNLAAETEVPATTYSVSEQYANGGWRYHVTAQSALGATTVGPIVVANRIGNRSVAATPAAPGCEIAWRLRRGVHRTLSPLAELAALSLPLESTAPETMCGVNAYWTVLREGSIVPVRRDLTIKVGARTYVSGIETRQPIAFECANGFDTWDDAARFAEKHPAFVWVEDPVACWPPTVSFGLPIVLGEHARSVAEIEDILNRRVPSGVQLELSRLGPVAFIDAAQMCTRAGARVLAHGHLPMASAFIARLSGVEVEVEINLPYAAERCGAEVAARLIDDGPSAFHSSKEIWR